MSEDEASVTIKILVIGDHLTGKSTFLEQFCNKEDMKPLLNKIFDYKKFTYGCDLHIKKIHLDIKELHDYCAR